MVKSVLRKIAGFQERYPLVIIIIILTLSLFFVYYGLRLETNSSFNVMYRADSESKQLEKIVDIEFGGTDTVFILAKISPDSNDKSKIKDIRHPEIIESMDQLKKSLLLEPYVASASSIADLYYSFYGRLPDTLEESKEMLNMLPEEIKEVYIKRAISSDYSYMLMIVSISIQDKSGYLQKIEKDLREKVKDTPFPTGVKAELTGMPILMNRIMNYLINDNLKTVLYAVLGVIIVLWIYFRSWKIAVISAVPMILTLCWLAGTMYLLGIEITVMTASIGAMMIGMSVDYSIHLTHRFHENIKEGHKDPVGDTVVSIGSALFASVTTTIAGFLAMLLGISPNSQVQGSVLSIGIAYAFITSLLILPPLMVIQRKIIYSKLDETIFRIAGRREETKENLITIFLRRLSDMQVKRPYLVLTSMIIITLILIPGFTKVYLDTDGENWVPEGDDILIGMQNVGYNFGGTESMNFLFMLDKNIESYDESIITDLRDSQVISQMAILDTLFEDLDYIDSVDSPTQQIKRYNEGRIPKDYSEIRKIIEENPDIKRFYNKDYSIAKFTPTYDFIERKDYYEMLALIDLIKVPSGVKIVPQGAIPADIEFEKTMGADTIKTTLIGFFLVILIASLFYRSIAAGFLAFIPIIFAIIWTISIMGYINLPFTVLTTGMLAILMGMGIDFSIHLIHSIKEKLKEYQDDIGKALPHALMSTGQAISITTITTIIGFLALSFATLVNTMRLGWTLALGIGATFFSCIIIVPSIMAIKQRIKIKATQRGGKNEK